MKKKLNKELDYEKTGVFESSNSGKEGGLSQQGLVTPLLQFANRQKTNSEQGQAMGSHGRAYTEQQIKGCGKGHRTGKRQAKIIE